VYNKKQETKKTSLLRVTGLFLTLKQLKYHLFFEAKKGGSMVLAKRELLFKKIFSG